MEGWAGVGVAVVVCGAVRDEVAVAVVEEC